MEVEENAGAGGWASTSSGSSPGKEEPAPTAFFVRESEHLGFVRKEAPNAASHAAGRSLLAGKLPDLALRKPADGSLNSTDGRFESSLEAFLSNQENAAPLLDRTSSGELAAVHEKAISKTAWPLAAEKSVTTNTAAKKELPGSSSSQLDNSDCPIGLPEHLAPEGLPSAPSREGFSQAKLSPVIPRLEITDQSQSAGARGVNASGPSPVADISMDLEQWTQAARLAWQWTNTIRKELETAQCSNTQLQAEVVRLTEAQRSLGACGGGGDPEGAVQAMLEQCREELAQERVSVHKFSFQAPILS